MSSPELTDDVDELGISGALNDSMFVVDKSWIGAEICNR